MPTLVFKSKVRTRNFLQDAWAQIKNITGGELHAYARLIDQTISEAYSELKKEHPTVRNIRITTTMLMKGATEVIVYGEVNDKRD